MIYESNQGFSTFDTITIILSVVVISIIVVPILNRRVDSQYVEIAKRQAQEWSQKITSVEKLSEDSKKDSSGRNLASDPAAASVGMGSVGADPWGQPFNYQYVKNSIGQPVYVVVWSSGPNTRSETENSKMAVSPEGFLSVNFEGDDVGFVKAVR